MKEERKENLALNGEREIQMLESQDTIKNYPNLTTLFLPNGVLEAKPNPNSTLEMLSKRSRSGPQN